MAYAVAPDASYAAYSDGIDDATSSLYIEGYSLDNAHVVDILVDRLNAGVTVTVLLEEEIVNGISDQEKWGCEQIENADGQCWFMYNDDNEDAHDRYTFPARQVHRRRRRTPAYRLREHQVFLHAGR